MGFLFSRLVGAAANAGGGAPAITLPDHISVHFAYTMDTISGAVLTDDSGNGINGTIIGATDGDDGDTYLDFSAAADRVDPENGCLDGLNDGWESVLVLTKEDTVNGAVFEFDWEGGVSQDIGDLIVLNEPASTQMRFIMRGSNVASPSTVTTTAALPLNTKTVLFFGVTAGSVMFVEFGGTRWTAVITNPAFNNPSGESTLGNRETNASPFGGKIYSFFTYSRELTAQERLDWESTI